MEEIYINIDGNDIKVNVKRKKIKNIYLKITSNKEVELSIPRSLGSKKLQEFLEDRRNWLKKNLKTLECQNKYQDSKIIKNGLKVVLFGKEYNINLNESKEIKNTFYLDNDKMILNCFIRKRYIEDEEYTQNAYEKWIKESLAKDIFIKIVDKYCKEMKRYNIPKPQVEIKKMKSRWGACFYQKNKVILNFYLIKTPIECIEYVIVHELSHFKYQNHSKDFYDFVSIFYPNWKEARRKLNKEFGFVIQ